MTNKTKGLSKKVLDYLRDFESDNLWQLDTIRITFSKRYKLSKLAKIGDWEPVQKNTQISKIVKRKIKRKLCTSAKYLKGYTNIVYLNAKGDPRYQRAELIIFGICQYEADNTPKNANYKLMHSLVDIMGAVSSIDVCTDRTVPFDVSRIKELFFDCKEIKGKDGYTLYTNHYNHRDITKICIYDKQAKNKLQAPLWRFEATIDLSNTKDMELDMELAKPTQITIEKLKRAVKNLNNLLHVIDYNFDKIEY